MSRILSFFSSILEPQGVGENQVAHIPSCSSYSLSSPFLHGSFCSDHVWIRNGYTTEEKREIAMCAQRVAYFFQNRPLDLQSLERQVRRLVLQTTSAALATGLAYRVGTAPGGVPAVTIGAVRNFDQIYSQLVYASTLAAYVEREGNHTETAAEESAEEPGPEYSEDGTSSVNTWLSESATATGYTPVHLSRSATPAFQAEDAQMLTEEALLRLVEHLRVSNSAQEVHGIDVARAAVMEEMSRVIGHIPSLSGPGSRSE